MSLLWRPDVCLSRRLIVLQDTEKCHLFPVDLKSAYGHQCGIKRKGKPDIRNRFGFAVKKRRHELGISQERLADRSGLHRTYIGDIERGARNVSLENIEKLAEALEIPVSTLFSSYGVDKKP